MSKTVSTSKINHLREVEMTASPHPGISEEETLQIERRENAKQIASAKQ